MMRSHDTYRGIGTLLRSSYYLLRSYLGLLGARQDGPFAVAIVLQLGEGEVALDMVRFSSPPLPGSELRERVDARIVRLKRG
jgi:hypothetical protein